MMRTSVSGEHFVWLGDGDVATVGGKAAGLGRLIDAGLPVPPGAVITTAAFRAGQVPAVDMPGPLAVRSSATIEDGARGAAPGLFDTVLDVETADIADAVRRVWASAEGPAVDAYLEARQMAEFYRIPSGWQPWTAEAFSPTTRVPRGPGPSRQRPSQRWNHRGDSWPRPQLRLARPSH